MDSVPATRADASHSVRTLSLIHISIGNPSQSSVIVGKEHNTMPDVVSHKDRSEIPRIREEPDVLTEKGPVRGLPNETPPSVSKLAKDVAAVSTRTVQPKSCLLYTSRCV